MTWLVTGGAGYIGAHVVQQLVAAGERAVVLDDLSTGEAPRVGGVPLVRGSVLDEPLVARAVAEHAVTGVVHLAAKKAVEESGRRPLHYYRENVEGLRVVLSCAADAGVGSFLFSSSAAVYGAVGPEPVREDAECRPISVYGRTKLIGEQLVADTAAATGMRYACLRYFNVAGSASPALADRGASNLVPMVLQRLAARQAPLVFGEDYPTDDGTCVRDFVHVADVASAHVAASRALADGRVGALTVNVGRGVGVSVREMVSAIREVTGTDGQAWAEPEVRPRRPGDPARVVAAADLVREVLGWTARCSLRDVVDSARAGMEAHAGRDRGEGTRR